MMKAKLKSAILVVMLAWEGMPFPEAALVSAVQAYARHLQPTGADVGDALKDVESEGFAAGLTDAFSHERSWTLTEKGLHKARQLR